MKKRIKVLHATMSLNIGGAETHIVELAKFLDGDQYEIHVASNGGVYEKDLKEAGISHHQVPLHTKNPLQVVKAYRGLKKIISQEHIDIVHAHARIPGFIAGIICRKLGVEIVTTTHFPFKVNYLWRRITNWGNKSIAVSEDLKAYLQKEYDYDEKDVYLSVNGIDTNKFKPNKDREEGVLNIVQVSRLDAETSEAAQFLIDRAGNFYQLDKRLRVVIVGGGTELETLKKRAEKVNKKAGIKLVTMTGPVSDVPAVLNTADIFVGISRSALEAMCCEVPIVLAGNYGMYGYLDQAGLTKSEPTNFTGRGEAPLSEEALFQSVKEAWEKLDEDYSWTRAYIQEKYSVARMAQPYLDLYHDILTAPKRYVVAGYYGYANSGDESLLDAISRDLVAENPKNRVTILTKQLDSKILHGQVKGVYRFDLKQVVCAIKNNEILVMGGGSLLQDKTSSRSLMYYLGLIWLAELYKKKTYLYANGIGPIDGNFNRWLTRKVVNRVDVITLRESNSKKTMDALGITKPYIEVTADPVFTLDLGHDQSINPSLLPKGFDANKPYGIVIARPWKNQTHFIKALAATADRLVKERNLQILLVPLKFPDDLKIEKAIAKAMKEKSYVLESPCSVDELVAVLGSSQLILSMRLHGIIYGAIKSVPSVGLSYDVKVNYYTEALGLPLVEDITKADAKEVWAKTEEVYDHYETLQRTMADNVADLTEKAKRNADLLKWLF